MNDLLKKLSGGTLASDGDANAVADEVLLQPHCFEELMQGLYISDDIIRGRTTHALEKISRVHPEWFSPHLNALIKIAEKDKVPFVR